MARGRPSARATISSVDYPADDDEDPAQAADMHGVLNDEHKDVHMTTADADIPINNPPYADPFGEEEEEDWTYLDEDNPDPRARPRPRARPEPQPQNMNAIEDARKNDAVRDVFFLD